ncbi:MAG: polysaccharide biosynthesis protein [Oscillospiraceae bacterium]|nr:polysaccharide biosynthesis protein [Oscillospiraceae bacterium]
MNLSKKRGFFHGAAALAIGGVIVKLCGAGYKIPLGAVLGPVGMANFSIAYNIYSLLFVIATAGVPTAVSKMVAEELSIGRKAYASRIFEVSGRFFFFFGICGFAVMFFGAPLLSQLMGSDDATAAIRAISPAVIFVSVSAVSRGYFQGHSDMYPTAVSEVAEAVGKLAVGLSVALILKANGASLAVVTAGAVSGVSVGALVSALYFEVRKRKLEKEKKLSVRKREILKKLLSLSVPITIGAAVVSLTAVIDGALVLNILKNSGFSEYRAKWLFGGYTYASTLFGLPSFFVATIASALVPMLAAEISRRRVAEADKLVNSAMRITVVISSVAAFGLAAVADGVLGILYGSGADGECLALSAKLLRCLCIGIVPLSVVTVTNAVHQTLGHPNIPVISIVCGGVLKIISNYILVSIPEINIHGAAISTVLCYLLTAIINISGVKKYSYIGIELKKVIIKPLTVGIAVYYSASFALLKTKIYLAPHFSTLFAVFVGALVAIIGTFLLKNVKRNDAFLVFGNTNIFKFIDND